MIPSEKGVWQLFFPPRAREQDPDFRSVLSDILHTGLRQCGAIGLVGALLYVGLSVFGLGYEIHWTYRSVQSTGLEHQVVATGTLIVAALSVIGLVLAQMECSLRVGRLFGIGAVLLTATVATFEGALRGGFGTEYVIPMYLVIVAIVPFRPIHVLGIGSSVAAIVYGLGPSGLAWASPTLTAEMARHLAFISGSSVLITGTSVALYRRHRAFASAQASLQKNRDLLRRVQSVAQVGGWEYDPDTDAVEGTEELYRILGQPSGSALDGKAGLEMHPPEAREELRTALQQCLEEGDSFDLETPLDTAEGDRRWVRVRAQARERHDDTVRLIGTLQDITERREMQERLRERERLLRSITDNVNDGIYRIVPQKGLVYANEAFAHIFGYESVEDVLTLDPAELCASAETPSPLLQVTADEASSAQEVVFRRTDGSTFTGLLDGTVVHDEDGNTEYVDGVVTDISALKERERDLQRERDRFETLFQNLPTPVVHGVLVNGGARVQTVNREFEEVFGYDAESAQGESMCDLIGPEENPSAMSEIIQRAFEEGTLHTEVQRQTPNGMRTFQLHFAARHREGQRTEGYAMFVDVTGRKRREEALRERERKIEALYTATERLLRADDEERVADRMEDLVRETFDYPLNSVRLPEEDASVPTRTFTHARSSVTDLADPEADLRSQITETYRSGETVVAEDLRDVNLPVDYGSLRSAAFLPIAGHGLMSIGSEDVGGLPDFDLRLLEILSTHASVVLDRIDHEQDLRRSEQHFRGVFENAGIGIALIDAEGQILKSNPALQQMLRVDGDDLHDRPFEQVTHPDELKLDPPLIEDLSEEEAGTQEAERLFVRDDGDVFWGSLTVSPYRGPGETELIGMVEDIDDRKRQEQQLKKAKDKAEEMSRLKSAFLANMSHEIRTPLTSILGFAEAIGNADETDEEVPVAEFARRITKSGNRLLDTLDSVLDLSQLEAGSMELSPEAVDLTQRAQEAADRFEQKAKTTGVTLQAEVPDQPIRITADENALERIQRGLLSNALKYTEDGGQAWIRVRDDEDAAVLEVEDTGIGMDPEQVDQLFDAFEQASTGTDRLHEGSGLGLALVDRLVDRMGGSIEVETEKGVGTCFTVRFPKEGGAAGKSAE
ncbi:MAG: PAS domain S-box protein [Salinibacter sp.]